MAQLRKRYLLTINLSWDSVAAEWPYDGEEQVVRSRHAMHVCEVLERAVRRPESEWMADRCGTLDDLRSALDWTQRDECHRALRIRLTVAAPVGAI